ncbi:ankyrin repeat-containing domain protein [Trichoderma chlorosporum]
MSDPNNYSVGWICAIRQEYVAAQAFLDEKHEPPEYLSLHDNNDYSLGRIGKHNVAIAVLPYGEYGLASAAGVARDMLHSFPNIRIGLMVGIGGGAPSPKHDIRLGDVVVGISSNGSGGVFQYDYGETLQGQGQGFKRMMFLNKPPWVLLAAASGLMAQHESEGNQLANAVTRVLDGKPKLRQKYGRPRISSDRLYKSSVVHSSGDGEGCLAACGDDPRNLVNRTERTDEDDDPVVHYGLIASANQLMADALTRDSLIAKEDVLCFETEAAGLINHFPCLIIRGVCDYSDSHKNHEWQGYAAMTAAAYAKALLCRIASNKLEAENRIKDKLSDLADFSLQHLAVAQDHVQVAKEFAKERLSESYQMCHQLFRLTVSDKDVTYEWYKDVVEERVEGTCMWFLHHENFQKWLQQESGPLVVTADPGCGKSVLAKYLIDRVLPSSATVCYFFFKDQDQNTVRQALCAILHQLFIQKPELIEHAMARLRVDGTGLVNSTESLWNVLRNAVNDIQAGAVIIVLDALDECAESEFQNLMKNIEAQFSEMHLGQGKLRYLLTCRPYEQLVSRFRHLRNNFPNIHIPGEEESDTISEEINCVITYRTEQLSKKKNLSSEIKNHLKFKLCSTPHRTYLWVFFIFDYLDKEVFKKTFKEVNSLITTLPRNINEAYEQILNRSKDHPMVRKAMCIILVANRPLTLSEMNVAVSIDNTVITFEGLDLEDENCFESRLRSWCGLFITIYQGKVYFIHQTARDFLLADSAPPGFVPSGLRWEHSITNEEAQTVLANLCVFYLELFNSIAAVSEGDQLTTSYTFSDYAAKNWNTHVNAANTIDIEAILHYIIRICDMNLNSYSAWFDLFWSATGLQPTKNFTSLMLASYSGHTAAAKFWLESGHNIEARDTAYSRTPLLWATIEGRDTVVKLLIEKGADIDAREHGRTSLSWAVYKGYESIIKLLLDANADTEARDTSNGQTPLIYAVKQGHEAIVKLLLEKKADIEARDALFGQTPLMWAADERHDAIVKLLLENGADIEAKDNTYGQTSLLTAVNKGSDTILKVLLQNGANTEVKNKGGWTPLSSAAARNHTTIVKLLLEWNTHIEIENTNIQTALFWAIKRREVDVVGLLLNHGLDINARNDNGLTALLLAIQCGNVLIVEMLLSRGAGIEESDKERQTPVIWAIKERHKVIINLLLKQKACVNVRDIHGQTPLHFAVLWGHAPTVQLLLQLGADVDASANDGQTPLIKAIKLGWMTIVDLLLNYGADVDKPDIHGQTPLVWALKKNKKDIVDMLWTEERLVRARKRLLGDDPSSSLSTVLEYMKTYCSSTENRH